jgi:pimeloyl-ACP methyl ester carboxylesterase
MVEAWEDGRREAAELAWEPYMHNPSLYQHLKGLGDLNTLIVWGGEDAHVPETVVRDYVSAIPQNTLKIIPASGHHPELEAREEFVKSVTQFLD